MPTELLVSSEGEKREEQMWETIAKVHKMLEATSQMQAFPITLSVLTPSVIFIDMF